MIKEFGYAPPDEYLPVLMFIERHMALYCAPPGVPLRDAEFERLFYGIVDVVDPGDA